MTDDAIGKWYDDRRKKADEIREKLKQPNLSEKQIKQFKEELERALYVGD